jgi:hypothetical protein
VQEERSHHPSTRKKEGDASIVEAKIISLLNVPTIVSKVMMTRRARRKKRRRRKPKRRRKGRRVDPMLSLRIVMLPQVMMKTQVMMTSPPRRRRVMQALLSMRSLPSSTLHHASWLRPLRYKLMMRVIVKVAVMMNQLKMN